MTRQAPLTDEQARSSAGEPKSGARSLMADARPTLRQVFDEHAAFVWRTLRHLGVPEADIEDSCQDVFVAIHRKLEGFEGRSSLRTWIYGICLRVASDRRRRAHVRREVPVADLPPRAVEPTQIDDYQRGQARALLWALLDQLDDDKRAVFVLYEIEGLAMKEIAGAVGCPLQTAYSRLHAARKLVLSAAQRESSKEKQP